MFVRPRKPWSSQYAGDDREPALHLSGIAAF